MKFKKIFQALKGYYLASNEGRIKFIARELNFHRQSKTRAHLILKLIK